MILPITLTVAGAAALLHLWIGLRVARLRQAFKVSIGDGGNEALVRRIRAHANYGENMPIFVILIGLLELAGANGNILWAAAILFILARICHAFGMDRPSPSRLRMIGSMTTGLLLIGLAGWALSYAYRQPPMPGEPHEIHLGPGRSV
jgi:uncharacterized membrane protein YecN with MAPEG domain